MEFVLQEVIEEPKGSFSLEPLKKLKKDNLAKVAAHLGITMIASGVTEFHILD